jgi:hypothetical protein
MNQNWTGILARDASMCNACLIWLKRSKMGIFFGLSQPRRFAR